jgi:hypothetical protein
MNTKPHDFKWYQKQVKKLIEINKNCPVQKTKPWYEMRNCKITASEASSCLPKIEDICSTYEKLFNVKIKYNPNQNLSSYDTKEDYIINKCRTFYGENLFKDNIYTLHGKKFEEISTRLYRKVYNTQVLEFGLLPHSRLSWLGASPDGITPQGIMLEIKNPNKMYIIPSMTYFTQMQIQMETANLDECDFLVCDVKNIDTEQEFIDRIINESPNLTIDNLNIPNSCKQYKGILLNKVTESDNSNFKYIYPPDSLDTITDFLNWKNNTILEYQQQGIQVIPNYYIIQEWSVIRINRNREWFNIIKPYLKSTMDLIKKLQADPQLFKDYRESIHKIRSKEYYEIYNSTVCLIEPDHDEPFVINSNVLGDPDEMDIDIPETLDIDLVKLNTSCCLISDS